MSRALIATPIPPGFKERLGFSTWPLATQSGLHSRVPVCQWKPFGGTPLEHCDVEVRAHAHCHGHELRYQGITWDCGDGKGLYQSLDIDTVPSHQPATSCLRILPVNPRDQSDRRPGCCGLLQVAAEICSLSNSKRKLYITPPKLSPKVADTVRLRAEEFQSAHEQVFRVRYALCQTTANGPNPPAWVSGVWAGCIHGRTIGNWLNGEVERLEVECARGISVVRAGEESFEPVPHLF